MRIIVLGAERSGTSVVTEMIHRWGAYAGEPEELEPPSEHSPHGQWEWHPLWDLLSDVGDFDKGETWWDPQFASRVAAKAVDPGVVAKANALMARMGEGPWVWKDPALAHFLDFWTQIWGDVTYVITVRHPMDVARSWQQMTAPDSDLLRCNLLRWQYMMLSILRATEGSRRKLFVSYERLIADPVAEAVRLTDFLGERRPVSDAVDPSLRHNHEERPLADFATPAQAALYAFLLAKIDDPFAEFVDDYPMPDDWWELVRRSEQAAAAGSDGTPHDDDRLSRR